MLNDAARDNDAIELAKEAMKEDGYTAQQIASARYVVR